MGAYKILCFDGGGIRGLLTAVLLERIVDLVPDLIKQTDMLAGTSTGAIIALGLAAGLTPSELVSLYKNKAQEIFADSWFDDIKDQGKLTGADYDNENLKKILMEVFGKTKLRSLKKRVIVPAFDLDNEDRSTPHSRKWKPKFFHNFPGDDSDGNDLVADVALRTTAAPTYFPAYQGYIDGGVVANNPSMAALAQALDKKTGKQQLSDLKLFSIGTGTSPLFIEGDRLDWGYMQWAFQLPSLMIDGMMGVADYQCARILGDNYFRLAPNLEKFIDLDDVKEIDNLVAFAEKVDINQSIAWLSRAWEEVPAPV